MYRTQKYLSNRLPPFFRLGVRSVTPEKGGTNRLPFYGSALVLCTTDKITYILSKVNREPLRFPAHFLAYLNPLLNPFRKTSFLTSIRFSSKNYKIKKKTTQIFRFEWQKVGAASQI